MANETYRYTLKKPVRMLAGNITQKSSPPGIQAEPKFFAQFGMEEEDFKAIVEIEKKAIVAEFGTFTSPAEYYLACVGGTTAANRVLAKANLDAQGKAPDEAFKIKERAEKKAELFRQFAGIMSASSKFDVSLAKLDNGAVVDIAQEHEIAQAGKDLFYPGAWVVPAVAFKAYRRKNLDSKDGVTAFLQNVLWIRNDTRLIGSAPDNKQVFGAFSGYSDYDPTALAPDGTAGDTEDQF